MVPEVLRNFRREVAVRVGELEFMGSSGLVIKDKLLITVSPMIPGLRVFGKAV